VTRRRSRVILDEALARAGDQDAAFFLRSGQPGSSASADEAAARLRAAGAEVSRDSHARWFARRDGHPAVAAWLASLHRDTAGAAAGTEVP
jgi:hypothetical protein